MHACGLHRGARIRPADTAVSTRETPPSPARASVVGAPAPVPPAALTGVRARVGVCVLVSARAACACGVRVRAGQVAYPTMYAPLPYPVHPEVIRVAGLRIRVCLSPSESIRVHSSPSPSDSKSVQVHPSPSESSLSESESVCAVARRVCESIRVTQSESLSPSTSPSES